MSSIGVVTAVACEQARLGRVLLVERASLGSGASGGAAGLLIPEAHPLDQDAVAQLIPDLADPLDALVIPDQARVNPLLACARLAATLSHVATGVDVHAVGVRRGRVVSMETNAGTITPLAGGTLEPDGLAGVDVVAKLRRALNAALPRVAAVGTSHAWCCFRPTHPDGLPVLDRVSDVTNAWFTSGHFRTGVLMAPAVATILVKWISTGEPPGDVAGFEAHRFAPTPG